MNIEQFKTLETEILNYISKVFKILGKEIDISKMKISFQDKCHKTPKFNYGKMYIYSFWHDGSEIPLKIGKAGPNTKARYTYHHYNKNSSNSCLANSIFSDTEFVKANNIDISTAKSLNGWIHNNCQRINIEMPYDENSEFDMFTLELIEAILHRVYKPKYEGKNISETHTGLLLHT